MTLWSSPPHVKMKPTWGLTAPWNHNTPSRYCAAGASEAGSGLLPAGGGLAEGIDLSSLSVCVAGKDLHLVVPDSVDHLLDMYISKGMEDRDPYWARPWHSAIAMAEELLERPELVRGKSVVDVGAGLGVGGIAAAMAGASRVVMLDREPLALQCALLSARACGLPHVADPRNFGPVNVEGEASTLRGLLTAGHSSWSGLNGKSNAASPSIEAGLLDWLDPVGIEGLGRFDVVIACDVLYEDFSVEPVAALLPRLVGTRSGDIILADPPDRTRRNRERFLELLRTGLQEVRLKEFGRRSVTLEDLTSDVQVLLFRKTYGGMTSTIGIR